ncbi:MAG: FKBP-type peptidyl-prolyl cis-trans isomerase [Bacteroidota bacterium]
MRIVALLSLIALFMACELEGVDDQPASDKTSNVADSLVAETADSTNDVKKEDSLSKQSSEVHDSLELESGIKIKWFQHGDGPKLEKGDVIKIDYRNKLEDGTVYDGNHLVKKPYLPFVVGWGQQTEGWDIAMQHLRIGDDVDIEIPSHLARGEKGIEGVVPPNADNFLSLRILGRMEPIKEVDGIKIWKVDEPKTPGDSIEYKDEVYLDYWVSSESSPRYDNSYKRKRPFHLVMGDGNIVPGLYKALHFAREGDKLLIFIPSREAYGEEGLKDLVGPNEDILYDVRIGKVIKQDQ